jgi:hypothetical protein
VQGRWCCHQPQLCALPGQFCCSHLTSPQLITLCDILTYLHAVNIRCLNCTTAQPIEARHFHSTVRISNIRQCVPIGTQAVCTAMSQYHRALCDSLTPVSGFVASFRPSVLQSARLAIEVPCRLLCEQFLQYKLAACVRPSMQKT